MPNLSAFFSLGDLPGHISYVLIAISYYLTNIFWLRVVACFGLMFEIVYFLFRGENLATGIAWDVIFIAINLWQLWSLARDRYGGGINADDRRALSPFAAGLDPSQVTRIVRVGEIANFKPGEAITRQGAPVRCVALIISGRARVMVDGAHIASIGAGGCVGEGSFATGEPASATVTVDDDIRALVIEQEKLRALCAADEQIAAAVYRLLSKELAAKLKLASSKAAGDTALVQGA